MPLIWRFVMKSFLSLLSVFLFLNLITMNLQAQTGAMPANKKTHHTEAYKLHPERGDHINVKVTPPELRGKQGFVAIEVYNYSKTYISVMEFDIILTGKYGISVTSHIQVEDLEPKWSDMRWAQIPPNIKLPVIQSVQLIGVKKFDDKGKEIKLKVYTDLIKS